MGLDIYLREISSPDGIDTSKIYTYDELEKIIENSHWSSSSKAYGRVSPSEYKKIPLTNPIKKLSKKIREEVECLDVKKYAASKGIKRINYYNVSRKSLEDDFVEISINKKVFTEKLTDIKVYTYSKIETWYIYNYEETCYQRGTTDIGWEYLSLIGNCVPFHSYNVIREMVLKGALNIDFLEAWTENSYFEAWW